MKKPFWAEVLLLFLILFSCSTVEQDLLTVDYYNLARDFQLAGKMDRAEFYYLKALESTDAPLDIHYNLALLYIEGEHFQKADDQLQLLEKKDPENRELLRLRIYLNFSLEDVDAAARGVDTLLALYSKDPYGLEMKARLLKEDEQWISALEALGEIREKDLNQKALLLWVDLLKSTEDRESLIELLHKHRNESWLDQPLKEEVLSLYQEFERFDDALLWLDQLEGEFPLNRAFYRFQRAQIRLQNLNLWDAGLKELRRALMAGYQDTGALNRLRSELEPDLAEEVENLIQLYRE